MTTDPVRVFRLPLRRLGAVFLLAWAAVGGRAGAQTADLSATLSGPSTVAAGSSVAYSILVTNFGPSAATGVVVTDVLPAGVTFVPAASSSGCANNGGTVMCSIGLLASGASYAVSVVANAPSTGTLKNVAGVISNEFDSYLSNNSTGSPWTTTVACPAISVSPATLPGGAVGVAYASTTVTASGGTAPYTFSSSPLPPGLTLIGSTGVLSGTPTTAGSFTFTVTATDRQACAGTRSYTVVIASPPTGSGLYTVAPCRAIDTRLSLGAYGLPSLQPNATRTFALAGRCAIPSSAKAIAVNLTITNPAAGGKLNLYPSDIVLPGTGVIDFSPGDTLANNAVITVSANGTASVNVANASTGTVDLIVDVIGYFQ